MLGLINSFADGFVATPVIEACRRHLLFGILDSHADLTIEQLALATGANDGQLRVAMRLLLELDWVEAMGRDTYRATPAMKSASRWPTDIDELMRLSTSTVFQDPASVALRKWLERAMRNWDDVGEPMAGLLTGALLSPLLVQIDRLGGAPVLEAKAHPEVSPASLAMLRRYFEVRGWGSTEGSEFRLNSAGQYLIKNGAALGTVVSYQPMLARTEELLFGNAVEVFGRDTEGHERHIERQLNVTCSGFQHRLYFEAFSDLIVDLFDREALDVQPSYIADMGCGDGTLLRLLYDVIQTRTKRGKALESHPLLLIGADFNERALQMASRTLAGLPHVLVVGDIGDPQGFIESLNERGITDPEKILHIRSFLDHDRDLRRPLDEAAVVRRGNFPFTGVYADQDGKSIEPASALQSLVEHLQRWREVTSRYGLAMLEVHCLSPQIVRRLGSRTGALHFDAYHGMSRQHLFEAPVFLMAAAEAGLYPERVSFRRFPRAAPFTRITLNRWLARPYRIRHPVETDIARLRELDQICWSEDLAVSEVELRRRISVFPQGQMLVEQDGRLVAALYSQRVAALAQLRHTPFADFARLHKPDGVVAHLLGTCVLPEMQGTGIADELLDFALVYFGCCEDIETVAGVTRCRDYARSNPTIASMDQYIRQRDHAGWPVDPMLRFHESHGATVREVVCSFRPEDKANGGAGVLIEYQNFRGSNPVMQARAPAGSVRVRARSAGAVKLATQVRDTIEQVLGERRVGTYEPQAPLMEMGLSSLDLLELRHRLGERVGLTLHPTFFFQCGTPAAIVEYLQAHDLTNGYAEERETSCDQSSDAATQKQNMPTTGAAREECSRWVRNLIEKALGVERSAAYGPHVPLMEMGLSSLDLLELRHRLGEQIGIELEATFFFQCGTPAAIDDYLQGQGVAFEVSSPENTDDAREENAHTSVASNFSADLQRQATSGVSERDNIAVISVGCRFPGAVSTPEQFWTLLEGGIDAIKERSTPGTCRKNDMDCQDIGRAGQFGGFLEDVSRFDASFFRISPREAELIDPQHRFLLEVVWEALERAGIDPTRLAGSNTGVFVGVMGHDYETLLNQQGVGHATDPHFATGNAASIAAGRIAYYFDLHGPALSVDTACSSSLVAMHLACESLLAGECELAVAGGVNMLLNDETFVAFARAGMLSPDGRCKTFDASANGYVRGEGCAILILKRLADAQRDGDPIWAVIRGSAINQDGASAGLTAPNQKAQQAVIEAALKRSGIAAHEVKYLEAHGTGTPLGDPIEVEAAAAALGAGRGADSPLLLGSVKTNVGHLEAAAAVAGLIKVILSMRHGVIPKHLHFETPNRHIQWSRLPVKVMAEAQPWPDGKKVAGVSSFGFGGTNAHVVLEEYVAPPGVHRAWVGPVAVVLSARNEERLQVQVEQLRRHLETHEVRLLDLAYTLQVGREAMGTRLALVVESLEALKVRLTDYERGAANLEGVYRGELKRGQQTLAALTADEEFQQTIDKWLARGKVDRLAQIWAQGLTLEWEKLYGEAKPQRISLPTYPFAPERYWVPQNDSATSQPGSLDKHRLHPLVHRNTSDLSEQRYSTTLGGDEFFVSEHVVRGQHVVPGVVQLEWARAAASMALGRSSSEFAIRLTQVNWMRPLVVNGLLEVHVGLTQEEDGRAGYEIYSGEGDDAVVYSRGWAQVVSAGAAPQVDLAGLRAQCGRTIGQAEYYARLAAAGLSYGPSFVVLTALEVGDGVVIGALQRATDTFEEGYGLPPSLMDGALQASMELATTDGGLALPFALQAIEQWGAVPSPAWAVVRPATGDSAAMRKLDVEIVDETGQAAVRLSGFSTRMLEQREQTLLLAPRWTAQAIPRATQNPLYGVHRVVVCETRVPDGFEAELAPAQCVRLSAAGTLAERYGAYAEQLLAQVRQITADKPIYPVLLQLVLPLSGDGPVLQGLGALLLSARAEFPTLVIQTVAVEDSSELIPRLRAEALSPAPAVRYGPRGREVLDFTERHTFDADVPWRDGGVYWITGGLGGLGQIFARALVQGARGLTLVLSGRSALTAEHELILQGLRAQDARVEYRAVDVSDGREMAMLAQDIVAQYGQLNGVIHCAGVLRDSLLVNGTGDDLQQVLKAKVAGLVALDAATRTIALDWLVLCSSVASSWGNVGQAGYAAANGFMDSYALYRESLVAQGRRYGRMVSVSWPLWAEGGMKVEAGVAAQLRRMTGMQAMPDEVGVKALGQALAQTQTSAHVMVLYGERARLLARTQAAGVVAALQASVEAAMPEPDMQEDAELAERVERVLTGLISTHLKIGQEKLERDTPLHEFGLDSITLTSFSHVLNERYGLMLSPTVFFEAPTISALARYLAREHGRMLAPAFAPTSTREETVEPSPLMPRDVTGRRRARRSIARTSTAHDAPVPSTLEPIAVIGMSGSFPQAPDIDTLWTNLRAGRDCIGELPASRFGEASAPAIRHAGVLDGVDEFDPLFFGISPREARRIDPQQRLVMTYVHKAIEDAGYSVQSLSGSATALLVGTVTSGYGQMLAQAGEAVTGSSVAGLVGSMGPNRMSYWLNWHGPSEPVETACSSSLVAVHRAMTLLRSGQCAQAVVGGVNTLLSSEAHESFTQAGMLSLDGRCKAFSAQADGYVRAEGVGMLFLKPLSAAQRDGDHIYGLILGSAQNHGGRANSLSAPNPLAQARLVETAFRQAGVDPRTVGYIEAHGTGTALGDPVEVRGLKRAFRNLTKAGSLPAASIGLGTVKSNIGHLELAAGVAGLIKVLLQMRHGQLVKSLYSEPPNPQIDLKDSPFYVVNELKIWEAPVDETGRELPRRAGVSSFGFGGVNAHVVLEEYVAPPGVQRAWVGPVAVVLSARNEERLQVQVEQLRAYLETHEVRLLDLAYTLQVGREAMGTRLALVVESLEALKVRLTDYERGDAHLEGVYRGELKRGQQTLAALTADEEFQQTIDKWLARGKVDRLAQIWAQGLTLEWEKLYGEAKPQRISLPTYPFAPERYWLPQNDRAAAEPDVSGSSSDTARLTLPGRRLYLPFSREIRFELPLSRRTPAYLAEHCLFGATVVPAAFHLSLVLAALRALAPCQAWELADILFPEALILDDEPTIVQLILDTENGRPTQFTVASQSSSGWTVHTSGRISQSTPEAAPATTLALPPGDGSPISGDDFYSRHASSGYSWGRAFQWLEQIWPGTDEAWGRIAVARPEQAAGDSPLFAGLVDSWFHLMMHTAQWRALPEDILRIPFSIGKFSFWGTASNSAPLWASAGGKALALFDDTGRVVARIEGFEFRELHRADLQSALRGDVCSRLYEITWQPDDRVAQAAIPGVIVFAADGSDRLAEKLILPGVTVTVLDQDVTLSRRCETLAQIFAAASGPLWLVTRGAIDTEPAQSALWGVARAAALEHATVALQLIDLDPSADDATDLAALTDMLAHGADREQAAYRAGRRLVARLTRLPRARNETRPVPALHADATYLVTGGLGALGRHVAMWLVARGAKHVVLAGRRVPGENAGGANDNSQIRIVETDVADPSRVQALIALIGDEMPPLKGVIHAAGLLDDAPLAEQTRDRFEAVLAPKATGALNLDSAIANLPLDFFVCFSSVASVLGAQGQANYAAANAFVDALMQQRRARGYHGLSVNWGPWAGTGMAARLDPVLRRRVTEQGYDFLAPDLGIEALERLLSADVTQACVVSMNWTQHVRSLVNRVTPPLLSRLLPQQWNRGGETEQKLRHEIAAATAPERVRLVSDYLSRNLIEVLGICETHPIDPQQGFSELGLDSLMSIELKNRVSRDLEMPLSATAIFEYPTLHSMAEFLIKRIAASAASAAPTVSTALDHPIGSDAIETAVETLSDAELAALIEREWIGLEGQ